MAARQAVWFRIGVALCFSVLISMLVGAAAADQRLQNGGFEQGNSNWSGFGFSTSGSCQPRSGGSAATLLIEPIEGGAQIQQTITGVIAGAYTLRGYVRSTGGPVNLRISLNWQTASGQSIAPSFIDYTPGASYAAFSHNDPESPGNAGRVIVRITATSSGNATVCLDDLSLEGPPPATSTPVATATQTQTPTPTNTPTLTPTATSIPAAATNTPVPAANTATPQPTATTAAATSANLRFVNGGFEDDLNGWHKYGGELDSVSSPRRSGSRAAAFTSTTASTKWAYQVVAIDPGSAYELAGYLQADAGVAAAYLRISWYESSDASGSALATDDSTTRLSVGSAGFTYLTTGARTPPPRSRSARVRVMLAPTGASTATVYIDDVSFGIATVAPGAAAPPSVAAAPDEVVESSVPQPAAASASTTATPSATQTSGATPTPPAAVASSIAAGTPVPRAAPALDRHNAEASNSGFDAFSVLGLILGSALEVAGFGGAVFYKRWRGV